MKTRTLQWMALIGIALLAACTANTGPLDECVMNPDQNQLVCAGPPPERVLIDETVRIAR